MTVFRTRIAVVVAVALGALIIAPGAVAVEAPPNPIADIVNGLLGQSNPDDDPNGPGKGELPKDGGQSQPTDPNATGEVPANGGKFQRAVKGVDRPLALPGTGA